jgi:solute carrier family 25 (mitochondrial phosphate transporter), member 23/24/25/41
LNFFLIIFPIKSKKKKVLLQAGGKVGASGTAVTGIGQGIRLILKEEGVKAFWRGNGANVLKILPESSIKFYVFEHLKRVIPGDERNITVLERFISASIAGKNKNKFIFYY